MAVEFNKITFLNGSDKAISGLNTSDPAEAKGIQAAPRQNGNTYALSVLLNPVDSAMMNRRSVSAGRFGASSPVADEAPADQIFTGDGTARLAQDLFLTGIAQLSAGAPQSAPADEPERVAQIGNLLVDIWNQAKKSRLS